MGRAVDLLLRVGGWSYLFCCCLIQFNIGKVLCGEQLILCANLSRSTNTFQLSVSNDSCSLSFKVGSQDVDIQIGKRDNQTQIQTINTKHSLMDVCFVWNDGIGKYLISPENIKTSNLSADWEKSCCENFTLVSDSTSAFRANCSYLKGSNLTDIQFVNSTQLDFNGSSCSYSEPTASRCERMVQGLTEAASTRHIFSGDALPIPFNIALFSILFIDRILEDCRPSFSDVLFSSRLFSSLDKLLRNIYFTDQPLKTILTENVKVQLIGTGYNDFHGAKVTSNSSWINSDQTIEVTNSTTEITVPKEVAKGLKTAFNVAFTLYNISTIFQDQKKIKIVNDALIGITVGKHSVKLNNSVIITLTHSQQPENSTKCAFLEFGSNGAHSWNDSGCRTETNGNQTSCSCNHLTFFAVLLDVNRGGSEVLDPQTVLQLEYITMTGLVISIFFLVISIIYYNNSSKKTTKDFSSKIHLNLCIALLLVDMNFLLNQWLAQLHISTLCLVLAISLHYFSLSLFGWMGIEGFHLYLLVVKVFNTDIKWYLLKICLVAWGIPAVIVSISYGIKQDVYGNYKISANATLCWVTNDVVYYVTNVGIFAVVFVANTIMLIVVSLKIIAAKRAELIHNSQGSSWKSVFSVLSLNSLLGLTYGLGFLSFGHQYTIVLYLSTILNALQGLFLFLRQVALISFAWKDKMKNSSSS